MIRVASNGVRLLASEYPSPRKWGALGATHATAYTLSDATFRASGAVTGELFKGGATDTIRWSSGDVWRRYDDADVRRYRYLRISINETFRQRAGRIVEVDDIEIYGGVASHEDKVPPVGLEGRELPRPFRCWATTNTEDCFKAFDEPLATLIEQAQFGATQHVGRVPNRLHTPTQVELRTRKLLKELDAAVTAEQYERAARIRDELHSLEECGPEDSGETSAEAEKEQADHGSAQ